MAHITETHRSVLGGVQADVRRRLAAVVDVRRCDWSVPVVNHRGGKRGFESVG